MSLVQPREIDLLNRLFGNGAAVRIGTGPSSYAGVCFTNPGDTGSTSDEADYGGRKQVLASGWGAPASAQITNTALLQVWVVTGSATLQYFLLGDTATVNSTHDFTAALVAPVAVVASDQIRFGINDLTVSISGLLTHTYANDQLDMLLRNLTPTVPATYYYALSTTTPAANGTNFTEPSGGSYGRIGYARAAPYGSASGGSPASVTTTSEIVWPLATAAWGTVTYWGAFDAATGGNLLFFGSLDTATAINQADQPYIAVGDLTLTLN